MDLRKLIILTATIAILAGAGCWWFLDWGLGYESIKLRRNSSFSLRAPNDVEFMPSDHFVLDYIIGRRHSRATTGHGYEDRILVEFVPRSDSSGLCDIVQVRRIGYRRAGKYSIKSPDDAWVKIRKCSDHFHVEAAIKITASRGNGTRWEIVQIPGLEVN